METNLLLALAVIVIVIGMAGTVVPLIPGIPMVFGGLLLAAWAEGFLRVGAWPLVAIGVLAALSLGIDFIATLLGAKKVGASPQALVGATIGGIVGIFLGIRRAAARPLHRRGRRRVLRAAPPRPGRQGRPRHVAGAHFRRDRQDRRRVPDDRDLHCGVPALGSRGEGGGSPSTRRMGGDGGGFPSTRRMGGEGGSFPSTRRHEVFTTAPTPSSDRRPYPAPPASRQCRDLSMEARPASPACAVGRRRFAPHAAMSIGASADPPFRAQCLPSN